MNKQSKGMSHADYLRELTRRDPAFVEERKRLRDWVSTIERPPQPVRLQLGTNENSIDIEMDSSKVWEIAISKIWEVFGKFWPYADFNDVLGDFSGRSYKLPRDLIHVTKWDYRPSGTFIHTMIHESLSGDEVKLEWQKIKKEFYAVHRSGGLLATILPRKDAKTSPVKFRPETAQPKLKIYDMYVNEGKTFLEIGQQLSLPLSTVHRLFTAVCRDVGYNRPKGQFHFDPSFDLNTHFPGCRRCQTGELCSLAEKKVGLKPRYQRESSAAEIATLHEIRVGQELQKGRKR